MKTIKFTPEERKIIDRLLEESDEIQRRNGNRTYTIEEMKELYKKSKENAYLFN